MFALSCRLVVALSDIGRKIQVTIKNCWLAGVVVRDTANSAGGLGFNSRAAQIGHCAYISSLPPCFFGAVLPGATDSENGPTTRSMLRRNTASIIKISLVLTD